MLWIAAAFILSLRMPGANPEGALSVLMEPDGTGTWRMLIAQFEKENPDIPIQMVEGPPATNAREDLYAASFLSGKAGFDIVYCDVVWTAKFAAAGWLRDLTDRLSRQDLNDFLPQELEAGSYKGRVYRIPAFTDAGMLYYRKDLVESPPVTFDDLERQAQQLQNRNRWGFLWQGKQYEGLTTVFLEILWGFGGEWIDAKTKQVYLDSREAVKALEFLKKTIGTISPPAVTSYIEEDTRTLFQAGRAVFLRNWPYVWTLVRESPVKDKVAFVPMVHAPGESSAATLGGWGFAVSETSSRVEDAWKFVKFITGTEQMKVMYERMGRIPSRRNLVPAEFVPIIEKARMRPAIPEYAQASDILQRWVSAALTGRPGCEEALKKAAEETRALLGHAK